MLSGGDLWNRIRSRSTIVPGHAEIESSRILDKLPDPNPIIPQHHYFGIVVNELFLSEGGKWFKEYDPLILSVTEFVYGRETVTLLFVVGPKLLGNNAATVPQGMIYRDTRVAGVHPFRGGRVISTVVLSRSVRLDYTRQLLKLVESVSTAVPFGGDLGTYCKLTGSILDGIDALLGVGQTDALVGLRREFDHDLANPIRPAFFVLADAPESEVPWRNLWVRDGSLFIGQEPQTLQPFRAASYVLYSIRSATERTEIDTLPFSKIASEIVELAASAEEDDWKRAKAELLVLYKQLLTTPDLTRDQVNSYHEEIVRQALEAHERAKKIGPLSGAANADVGMIPDELQGTLRAATRLLDLD